MREGSLKLRPYLDEVGVMIGLEIHVQLNKLKTKIFCGCPLDYHDDEPNTHTCPVCLGLPGSLPVINRKSVEYSIKVGLALNCTIEEHTQFYRKNYYYPDLPKGFQITQYDYPIASNGYINIEGEDGEIRIRINRAHMEEDPGRLVHEGGSIERSKHTLIDYNRSGVALLEIVTEPDIRSPKEARRFLDKLRNILGYLDVVDTTLEGSMRVDANISLSGGSRSEVKNISSHKGAERALLFEIVRQKNLLRRGGKVVQETRHFDEARGVTVSLRTKEEAHDYRYFPEADLGPIKVADWAPGIKATLPELPDARREKLVSLYGITEDHAKSLTSEKQLADFYEEVVIKCSNYFKPDESIDYYIRDDIALLAAAWIVDVLKGELNYRNLGIEAFSVENMVQLLILIAEDKITDASGNECIRKLLDVGGTPEKIVEEEGLLKARGDIVTIAVEEVIAENPQAVEDYRSGKQEAVNFLMGQVMKKTRGRAGAKEVREMIIQRI
ncbi:MAG: Asp-tRNA(Asn)/Glu-tRNA(Gln) amidotransferase subunit GatB [ANME-2 cluster archaeon]|nr:Asp-tRNA(Asn)/Glu-tRNA(Gln) amidotransferase subunit GatB [ANME-2 cluster archaeon]